MTVGGWAMARSCVIVMPGRQTSGSATVGPVSVGSVSVGPVSVTVR